MSKIASKWCATPSRSITRSACGTSPAVKMILRPGSALSDASSVGIGFDRRVVDVVDVVEIVASDRRRAGSSCRASRCRGRASTASAPAAPPRRRPSASRRCSGRCARRSGRTGCSAPDRACCRGRTARRQDRALGDRVGGMTPGLTAIRALVETAAYKGANGYPDDRPAGSRRAAGRWCWSWC